MHIGLPEICRIVKHARELDLSPVPAAAQATSLDDSQRMGAFLVLLGRFSAQGRFNEQEYNFSVDQVSKKGITEEDIKILNFVMQVLTAKEE